MSAPLMCDILPIFRVSQVYLAVDERLASLKTDTFSKTREEKMEDIFAQKEVICFYRNIEVADLLEISLSLWRLVY